MPNRPAATACSTRRRWSLEACSRYSYRSHDPVVQTYRSAPDWRMAVGHLHRSGEILVKVFAHDASLRVRESHVQVALEHHQHTFDLQRGGCGP